ncbi:DUF1700 domain-containing protein [Saccharomonospora saliphila]|uniref:DUF1700 domain-containing protein n=1 Tax=Saccharomonospora saliphila TaxID=369829 RepID=UPI000380FD5E|nr:hypothetical protein [Saccharomonospora saliphila]
MSSQSQPAVRAYLARVRTALSDLPSAEVDEIVEDVRPHLAEIADALGDRASVEAMTAELGAPEDYAAEVRAAGEYPPPPEPERERTAATSAWGARFAFWGLVLGALGALLVGLRVGTAHNDEAIAVILLLAAVIGAGALHVWRRGTDGVRALPEVRWILAGSGQVWRDRIAASLRVLHPVWWVVAAVLLLLVGIVLVAERGNSVLGLPLALGLAGLVLWAGPRSRGDRRMLWASLPVSAFVLGAGLGLAGYVVQQVERVPAGSPYGYAPYGHNTTADGDPALFYGDQRLDNLYLFDADGEPLTDVYVYTEDGSPLIVPRQGCERATGTEIEVGEDNLFPRPRVETGAVDERGVVNGYNGYRPHCEVIEGVPFTVAVPSEKPGN